MRRPRADREEKRVTYGNGLRREEQLDPGNPNRRRLLEGSATGGSQGRLRAAHCTQAAYIDGARRDDVEACLIHIALEEQPDSSLMAEIRAALKGTSLTLKKTIVDDLVQAGHDAVISSLPLRSFLADYLEQSVGRDRVAS
jgi:hypothetical protein